MKATPACGYSADTEILTRHQGWVTFDRLTCLDEVATRSPDGEFRWEHPDAVHAFRHEGAMLHFRSQVFDLLLMPEHPLPTLRRGQRGQPDETIATFRPGSWFCRVPSRSKWWRMPTTSRWSGDAPEEIVIPAAERKRGRHHPAPEIHAPVAAWMSFLGWFLSEGYLLKGPAQENVIGIAQKREAHRPHIRAAFGAMGIRPRENRKGFEFNNGPLAQWLRRTSYTTSEHRAWNKRIPDAVMGYPPDLLARMFESMMFGDGHTEKTGLRRYVTTSKMLADQTVEVLQKMGAQGWYHTIMTEPGGGIIRGYRIQQRRIQYRVTERPGHASNTPVPADVAYAGLIHRISVPAGVIYVRRSGRTAWIGA